MMLSQEAPDQNDFPGCPASLSISFILILIFAASLFYASSTSIQAQTNDSTDDVVRVRTDLVTVPAFVLDTHGRRVAGLEQSDFAVRDNGRAVTLSYFAAGTEHVALAFALDTSGSIRELIGQQREAALSLFSRFGHGSRVAVLHFGEKAALTLPFTTDTDKAQSAFRAYPALNQRTAIFDAAATAIHAFTALGSNTAERRILILISDGLDTASNVRAADVINEARASGVSIYVIHLPLYTPGDGRLVPRPAAKGFYDLALKTGGRYFMVGDAKSALDSQTAPDLTPVFRAIEEDLQGQYVLGYYPDDATREASLHRIEINLTRHSERRLRVQSLREGYSLKP
jgi:Ca-activated chloride channel family protein